MKWDSGPGVWMSDFAPRDREVVDGNPIPCTTGGNDESRFSFSSSFSYHSLHSLRNSFFRNNRVTANRTAMSTNFIKLAVHPCGF